MQSIHEWKLRETMGAAGLVSSVTRQSNLRRLRVFVGTLIVALIVSLAYTFVRPAVYRASTLLEITPAAAAPASASTSISIGAPEQMKPFFTEVQVLTSRPVLEEVVHRLKRAGHRVGDLGPDPIAAIQSHIEAAAVENTNVVELVAMGERLDLVAPLLNTIVEVYGDRLMDAYVTTSDDAIAQADAEVKKLDATVASKRRDVESYRLRNNIVSLDREENEVLARVRNQSAALGKANERVATAEGNLRAITDAQAAGKVVVRARDNPTLANVEQRASQAREELQDLERAFTPEYLAKDPRAVALRARLAELDRQVADQRRAGQQAALAEAQEELTSAQAAVRGVGSQMAADRHDVAQFTAHFNEYKAQQDALSELETVYRDAVQRRARLEASERARMPKIRVLEAAATPDKPWRPLYWRDAAISVGGSLLLALLFMWLVELFNRPDPTPALIVAQALAPGLPPRTQPLTLTGLSSAEIAIPNASPALLSQAPIMPRELGHDEVAALLAAGDESVRLAILLLLSGISVDEAIALRGSDIDLAQGVIRVEGASARDVALSDTLRARVAPRASGKERLLILGGLPATEDTIDTQILCAAHDARLQRAAEINATCLRHTYIAFLVRQGIRFADLQHLVGNLPAQVLGGYAALSPAAGPVARETIDPVFPPVRRIG